MSRIGLKVLELPENVEIKQEGRTVSVKGPKGELSIDIDERIAMTVEDNEISFSRDNDSKQSRSLHGTTRSNVANMIEGVTEGFEKRLELVGVGYRAQAQGDKKLNLNVGLSHPVEFEAHDDITFETPDNNHIIVRGINKEAVGQLAAEIRAVRPPEPYKGKGIKYEGERIIRKEGKTGK